MEKNDSKFFNTPSVFQAFLNEIGENRSTTFQKFATFGKFFAKGGIAEYNTINLLND